MKKMMIATALSVLALATPLSAADIGISPGLPGWQELEFDDLTPNRWREEAGALVVDGQSSVSVLYTSAAVAPGATPVLRWRWRLDQGAPATDLTRKGGDDRSLSLVVGFSYDSPNASMGERMKRIVVENVAGADAPGRVIDLVWGGNLPTGTMIESPYSGYSGRIVTMETSAPGAGWVEESVNIADLYRRAWNSEPPPVIRVAVSSDGDDTNSSVSAQISDIRFAAE